MTKETTIRIHRIYNILLSISIVLAGACLIAGCLSIYYSGDQPYTREVVADTFSSVSIPVYLCLALTLFSFVWEFFLPTAPNKSKPTKAYLHILNRLTSKKDFSQCDATLLSSINKERTSRRLHIIIRTVLLFVGSVIFLIYALNGKNFHQSNINESMTASMWILLPCMGIPFIYAVFVAYHNEKSLQREIELIKQVPASAKADSEGESSVPTTNKMISITRFAILFIGIAILVYGLIAGGTADVLTKAINICTECIGLG